jgi:hypothetical protein
LGLHAFVSEHVEQASPDVLWDLLKTFVEPLLSAEA